jgi:hypothetical protein
LDIRQWYHISATQTGPPPGEGGGPINYPDANQADLVLWSATACLEVVDYSALQVEEAHPIVADEPEADVVAAVIPDAYVAVPIVDGTDVVVPSVKDSCFPGAVV